MFKDLVMNQSGEVVEVTPTRVTDLTIPKKAAYSWATVIGGILVVYVISTSLKR